jgi:hypothetical protein
MLCRRFFLNSVFRLLSRMFSHLTSLYLFGFGFRLKEVYIPSEGFLESVFPFFL